MLVGGLGGETLMSNLTSTTRRWLTRSMSFVSFFVLSGRRAAEVETPHTVTRTTKVLSSSFTFLSSLHLPPPLKTITSATAVKGPRSSSLPRWLPSLCMIFLRGFHEFSCVSLPLHERCCVDAPQAPTDPCPVTFSCDVQTLPDTEEVLCAASGDIALRRTRKEERNSRVGRKHLVDLLLLLLLILVSNFMF